MEKHSAQKPLAEMGGTLPPLDGKNPLNSFGRVPSLTDRNTCYKINAMGGDSDDFCMVRHALFSQGETLTNGAKVVSERRNDRKFFFKQLYRVNYVTKTPKVGLKLKIFART